MLCETGCEQTLLMLKRGAEVVWSWAGNIRCREWWCLPSHARGMSVESSGRVASVGGPLGG
jgi:hypothetical protein